MLQNRLSIEQVMALIPAHRGSDIHPKQLKKKNEQQRRNHGPALNDSPMSLNHTFPQIVPSAGSLCSNASQTASVPESPPLSP